MLTLLTAPAGYGKTALLSEWGATRHEPVAWISLTPAHAEVSAFLPALLGAIHLVASGFRTDVPRLPGSSALHDLTTAAGEIAGRFGELESDLVVVLDDYQKLGDTPVHHLLGALLEALPTNVRFIIASRIRPPLPLGLLRGRQRLFEVSRDDLRFQFDEVQRLLATAAGQDSPAEITAIVAERTAGWPACLTVVREILAEQADPRAWAERFRHESHPFLDEFLLDEALASQPDEAQQFMLRTAIADAVCAGLCDALLEVTPSGGNQAMLEYLEQRAGLIEALDTRGRWYHYPPLLADALRRRLRSHVDLIAESTLHARASAWLADAGRVAEAAQHAIAAGDAITAVKLLESSLGQALEAGDFPSVARQLHALSSDLIASRPRLLLARAWLLHFQFRYEAIPTTLEQAEALLAQANDPHTRELVAEIDTIRCIVALAAGDGPSLLTVAQRACANIPVKAGYPLAWAREILAIGYHLVGEGEVSVRLLEEMCDHAPEGTALERQHGLWGLGLVHLLSARPTAARQAARQLLTVTTERPLSQSWGHFIHGLASYELNLLAEARQQFQAIQEIGEAAHRIPVCTAFLGLIVVEQAMGNGQAALATLRALEQLPDVAQNQRRLATCRVFAARQAFLAGNLEDTSYWLGGLGPAPLRIMLETVSFSPALHRARLRIALGEEAGLLEAAATLDELEAVADSVHDAVQRIGVLAVRALLWQARGQMDTALQLLAAAVKDATPGGLVRTFVDLGPPMQSLLSELLRRSPTPDPYVRSLLAAFPTTSGPLDQAIPSRHAAQLGPGLVEALTWREADILRLLAERLSNKEIASALQISAETVKKHTSNIYQKLMVGTRREAVARAQALGLLSARTPTTDAVEEPTQDSRTA